MKERGSALYQLILLALSFYVLSALVADIFFVDDPEIRQVLQYLDFSVCIIFLLDFGFNFYKAENKLKYMKWGWIDLLSSIPMVDPLRWGRLARVVRILRFFRAIRSFHILYNGLIKNKIESLTLLVFIFVFISYSMSACIVLEFEKDLDSSIKTAESALWWAFLNLMNAKTNISTALSTEAMMAAIYLNKVGLLIFAYFNAILIAWLIDKRKTNVPIQETMTD